MIQFPTSYLTLPEALDQMPENVMHCRKTLDRLTDFLEGDLDTDERRLVEHHVSACATCRQALEELRLTISLLHRLPKPKPRPFVQPNSNDDAKPA
jgi:predicted anti-sigma-YlaC factor YlaD